MEQRALSPQASDVLAKATVCPYVAIRLGTFTAGPVGCCRGLPVWCERLVAQPADTAVTKRSPEDKHTHHCCGGRDQHGEHLLIF